MRWSFSLGKVAGIGFQLHIAFIILPAAVFLSTAHKKQIKSKVGRVSNERH
ncbi:MAG: hypothetical protein ACETWQ_15210 [Phycisphaerae bacterium]